MLLKQCKPGLRVSFDKTKTGVIVSANKASGVWYPIGVALDAPCMGKEAGEVSYLKANRLTEIKHNKRGPKSTRLKENKKQKLAIEKHKLVRATITNFKSPFNSFYDASKPFIQIIKERNNVIKNRIGNNPKF